QPQRYDWSRDRLAPLVNRVADRAREAGLLREDVVGTDLLFLQVALTGLAATFQDRSVDGRDDIAELYRRCLWVALDGLRPHRADTAALPIPPLTTEQAHSLLGSEPGDAPEWVPCTKSDGISPSNRPSRRAEPTGGRSRCGEP